jgi:hypothetical protein
LANYQGADVKVIDTKELNEHFCDDDEPQYDEDGYCRHCGAKEDECSQYKCWI